MKKIISLALAVLALALCALSFASCSKGGSDDVPDGMKTASAEKADYKFYVPAGEPWICDVQSGATTAYYSRTDTSNVSVMDFNVTYTDYSVEDWWKSFEDNFKATYDNFEVVSSENVTLDGVAALKTVFKGSMLVEVDPETGEDVIRNYQFMQVAAIKKGEFSSPKAYVITYTSLADGETFESHLDDVTKMIDNFKFN